MGVVSDLACEMVPAGIAERVALVMLPGAGMRAQDFRVRGFVDAIHERGLAVDAVMADIGPGDYVQETFGARLKSEIIDPLWSQGYRQIWLAGISLGAYGAMRFLQADREGIDGLLLLSPFLSTRGAVVEVLRAGGLDYWSPSPADRASDDFALLCWLKDHLVADALPMEIYLGWGEDDRYAGASRLLAARLPSDRVLCMDGDHDWATWSVLWSNMLDMASFARSDSLEGGELQ